MKSLLVHPEEELTSQKAWERYRDEECTSQAAAVQGLPTSEEAYGECNSTLTQARVNELRTYHFCGPTWLPGDEAVMGIPAVCLRASLEASDQGICGEPSSR
jgi:hypothetical protein